MLFVSYDNGFPKYTTKYTYDVLNRLTQEIQADGTRLDYVYDNAGNKTELTITKDATVSTTRYSYDALNRLSSVTSPEGRVTLYSYDSVGNMESITHANGNKEVYTYDDLNRLTRLEHLDSDLNVLASFAYTLDASGLRTKIEEVNRVTDYTYDNLGRMLTESISDSINGDYSSTYTYDKVGNRLTSVIDGVSTAYTYDNNDRLEQQGGTRYSYDNNGNTLTQTLDGSTNTYVYDAKNQLVEVQTPTQIINYTYNAEGIRTSKTEGSEITQYVVDSNREYAQVMKELVNSVETVAYTYGHDLVSQTRDNTSYDYHYDGLGSARFLSDTTGTFTDSYDYEAFGKLLNQTGNTNNSYKFAGEQYDEELEQYYLRARYFNPTIGRFTQQDTWMGNNSDPITLHKYLYANANPVSYVDPTGNYSMVDMSMAMSVRNTLSNIQLESYTNISGILMDPQGAANGIPAIAGTTVGLRLLSRFTPFGKACRNSFEGETLVSTETGLKPISEINIGDKVWAYNEQTGKDTLQEVVHLIKGEGQKELVDITLESGEKIIATANHPFYTLDDKKWLEAGELNINDNLLQLNDANMSITGLDAYSTEATVYNLTVDGDHTYYVGNDQVLSHNAGCQIPNTTTWNHIFRGEISSGGRITGYHHRMFGYDRGKLKVVQITRRGTAGQKGLYEGKVQYVDAGGNIHTKYSTFFPNSWSPKMVKEEVNTALYKLLKQGPVSGRVSAKGKRGIMVEMHIRNGKVETAYPVF